MAYDKSVANSDAITNIQNSIAPNIAKIGGYGEATCTGSTSFDMVVQSSGATQIRTRVNRGSWSEWQTLNGIVTITGLTSGPNTIMVEVKGNTDASSTGGMTVWKI